ncbi:MULTISPECIES: hypothetical protein [unclassified Hyphomicrobium]|uniref:hypothetical protein n=1 Tax=unclassified Hyphomicrobium TaxID=2619925 RepID=UPI0002FE5972|nr:MULTISPECIES: hypothetical protein [unclassified Hyphomicrobium]
MTEKRYRIVAPEHEQDFSRHRPGTRVRGNERPSLIVAASRDEPLPEPLSELAPVGPSPDF